MGKRKSQFFMAPNSSFDIGLNSYQLGVYLYLTRCSNNSDVAFPAFSTIAEKSGMSERKAKEVVKELEAKGLLKKIRRWGEKGSQSNAYSVIEPGIVNARDALTPVHDMHPRGAHGAQYKELPYKEPIDKENNTSNSHSRNSTPAYYLSDYEPLSKNRIDDVLDTFYECYKEYTGNVHPKLKEEQLERIYEELDNSMQEFDISEDMIRHYFEKVKRTDFNVNHFANESILQILNHRTRQ